MSNDINLISQSVNIKKTYSKLPMLLGGLFIVVFIIALSTILYSFALKGVLGNLSEEVDQEKAKIAAMISQKQKVLLISERLATVRKIISGRSNLESRVSAILAAIPSNFNVDAVNGEKDKVVIKVASRNLSEFDNLLEVGIPALAKDKKLNLKKIESSSFSRSGNYQLSLAFYFTEQAKK